MKKHKTIPTLLFVLTMVLLFASLVQKQTHLWSFKPLNGVFEPSPEPELTFETYSTGQYQAQMEPFLKENFGFREPLIRFYNQFLYDFFRKSYNKDIVVGKDHWLYFIQHVNEYYGTELYRWYDSNEEAQAAYDRQARLMWKLRAILKEYDVDLMVFMAPQKGFLYPEHLPYREKDTTTVNAREYYAEKFDEYGFPYIEMTKWFMGMKEADTLPFSLFPQTGAHWDFSAALATDSLMRFMGELKGIKLPQLHYGPLHASNDITLKDDHDIENLANLMRPIPHKDDRLFDAEVTFSTDSTTTQPSAIFIGTSFLMRMYYFVPFSEIFPNSQYWYYNSTVYYGKDYKRMTHVADLDMLQRLLDSDYVVWFSEGDQIGKMSFGFAERALMTLCVSEDRVAEVRRHLIDSLSHDPATIERLKLDENDSLLSTKLGGMAYEILGKRPERYLPELAGDSIPTARNPRIPEALVIRDIKKDSAWMMNLQCQTVIHNTTLEQVLKMEAQNVLNDRPLMRDEQDVVSQKTYVESRVKAMVDEIRSKPEMMQQIEEKAKANGMTLEQQIEADARWIVNYQMNNHITD
mgnify:FL=1